MLTIFSIPKPFAGPIALIQRNALASWIRLGPDIEVILLGNDDGVAAAAREFGARHEPTIKVNSHGTPLITDAFARARTLSRKPFLMYSNADMLYDTSLLAALRHIRQLERFLLCGRRWDMDVTASLVRAEDETWRELFDRRATHGRLHGPAGIDYFVFPREHDFHAPDFAVGRIGWDSWLVWKSRMDGVPVIDATADIAALHQNHDYASLRLGYQHWRGPERDLNVRAAGGLSHLLTLREASHELVDGTLVRPAGWRALSSRLATFGPYRWSLAAKRWLQQKLN